MSAERSEDDVMNDITHIINNILSTQKNKVKNIKSENNCLSRIPYNYMSINLKSTNSKDKLPHRITSY
mgnify:CR=1 FL=1